MAPYVRMYGDYQPFGHAGLDIACPVGTPVYAMASGRVLWADWGTNLPGDDSGAGWASRWYLYKGFPGIVTVIQHPWGKGIYAHLSSNDAAPAGAVVKEGDLIGYSGDTGGVAPHLHVEALINDSFVTQGNLIYGRTDPVPFFGTTTPTTAQSTNQELFTVAQFEDLKGFHANSHAKLNNIAEAFNEYVKQNRAYHAQTHAKLNAVKSVVDQIAKGQNVIIDWAKVEDAAKAGAAEALAENVVQVDVNVIGKEAA